MMSISIASKTDIPAIKALVNSGYRGEYSKVGWTTEADLLDGIRIDDKELEVYFGNPAVTILKYNNFTNEIDGCVYLEERFPEIYLGMLTVKPDLQGRGIGKKLLQAAEKIAYAKHCNIITITVIDTREELIAWYERHGYYKTGERKPFPSDSRFGIPKRFLEFIVMKKILPFYRN